MRLRGPSRWLLRTSIRHGAGPRTDHLRRKESAGTMRGLFRARRRCGGSNESAAPEARRRIRCQRRNLRGHELPSGRRLAAWNLRSSDRVLAIDTAVRSWQRGECAGSELRTAGVFAPHTRRSGSWGLSRSVRRGRDTVKGFESRLTCNDPAPTASRARMPRRPNTRSSSFSIRTSSPGEPGFLIAADTRKES